MKLNDKAFSDEIVAKIVKKGKPDDLAKFMLSGEEPIAAVQRYFGSLKAKKKRELTMRGDEWFLDTWFCDKKKHTGLSLFKLIAPWIIPSVKRLYIINTHLTDYSFLNNIKKLKELWLTFADDEHTKVLSALSSLESVNFFRLEIKGLNLQFLSSLRFSFNELSAFNFIFEADPKCDKIFQATDISLYGDEDLMNDFIFTRQNYENYFAIFPNAKKASFGFNIKIINDFYDLMYVANCRHYSGVDVPNRDMTIRYQFFDYSGYPNSEVLEMFEDDEGYWRTGRCPHRDAYIDNYPVEVICRFPWAIDEVKNRLAKQSLYRVPENSNGTPEDYYRLIIKNDWEHKNEFEVLKTTSIEGLLKAYGEISGLNPEDLRFLVGHRWFSEGIIADTFQDGDVIIASLF